GGGSLLGEGMKGGDTVRIDDWSREHRVSAPPYLAAHGVQAAVVTPLRVAGRVVGTLGGYYHRPRAIREEDCHALARLADHVGLALDTLERRRTSDKEPARHTDRSRGTPTHQTAAATLGSRLGHELNNPLTSILLCAQIAKQQPLQAELIRRRMEAIEQEAKRAAKIVKDLVAVVRRPAPTLAMTDLNDAINAVLRSAAHSLELDCIRVGVELEPLPPLSADARH